MCMKELGKHRNIFVVLLVSAVFLTVWFAIKNVTEAVLVFAMASVVLLVCIVAQTRQLSEAKLIWDNRILTVPSAVISVLGSMEKRNTQESAVSTFGILSGCRIYKWGCAGVHGVRLSSIKIDRTRIYLTFSDETETMQAELLHGMDDLQTVMEVKAKLWYETGVLATVGGW